MEHIQVRNANNNNLKDVSVDIPLGKYVVFVGKSGSGKTTLAADVIVGGAMMNAPNVKVPLWPALFRQRVAVPTNSKTLRKYLGCNQKTNGTMSDYLSSSISANSGLFAKVAAMIGVDLLSLDADISELCLTAYNRLRFIQFLMRAKSTLLVVDELAAGMSFFEASSLSAALRYLVDNGYSIIAIEHSLPLIAKADYVIEMGPGAGTQGGEVIFCGDGDEYRSSEMWTKTVDAMQKKLQTITPDRRYLKVSSIEYHGLQIPELSMPSSCVVNIIGASGSGKSTLLDIIYRAFDKSVNAWKNREGINGEVRGKNYVRRPYLIDQTPIGNNVMSTPATYTKIMDILRDLYAQAAIVNGLQYTPADFSYNSDGKCPACGGRGVVEILIDEDALYDTCDTCGGKRYRKDIEKVVVENLSIGDVLTLPCGELSSKFVTRKTLHSKIGFISAVGLSYLTLGQPSASLSGGESQRIKITKEMAKKLGDRCLFILDTPSKGLHTLDMENVLKMLNMLVAKSNSVLICDNSPFFVRNSDWIIALNETGIAYSGVPKKIPAEISKRLGLEMKAWI